MQSIQLYRQLQSDPEAHYDMGRMALFKVRITTFYHFSFEISNNSCCISVFVIIVV